jgi:hypothetical protein
MMLSTLWLYSIKKKYLNADIEAKAQWLKTLSFQDWSCLSLVLLVLVITPAWVCLQFVTGNGSGSDGTFSDTSMQSNFICGNFVLRGVMVLFR